MRPPAQGRDGRGRRRRHELRLELPGSRSGQRKTRRRRRGCCRSCPFTRLRRDDGAAEQQRPRHVDPHDAVPPAHREPGAVDRGGERERRRGAAAAGLEGRRALPEASPRWCFVSSSFLPCSGRRYDPGPSLLDPDADGAVVGGDGEGLAEFGVGPGELLCFCFLVFRFFFNVDVEVEFFFFFSSMAPLFSLFLALSRIL